MNKLLINLAALTALSFFLAGSAFAGTTSYGIAVSCTIPAIPGVNVPQVTATSTTDEQQAKEEQAQVEKEQVLPSTQEGSFVLTKSIYSR